MVQEENARTKTVEYALDSIKPLLEDIFEAQGWPELQVFSGLPKEPGITLIRAGNALNLYPDALPGKVFEIGNEEHLAPYLAGELAMRYFVRPSQQYESLAGPVTMGLSAMISAYVLNIKRNNGKVSRERVSRVLYYMMQEEIERFGNDVVNALQRTLRDKDGSTRSTEEFLVIANYEIDRLMRSAMLKSRYLQSKEERGEPDFFMYQAVSRYGPLLIAPAMDRYFVRKDSDFSPKEIGAFIHNLANRPKFLFNLLKGEMFYASLMANALKGELDDET